MILPQEAAVSAPVSASLPLVIDPFSLDPQLDASLPLGTPFLTSVEEPEPKPIVIKTPEVSVAAVAEMPVVASAPEAPAPVQDTVTPPAAKALGAVAMLGVAGLIATTLAVDITDAALMGAILTAGAAYLPLSAPARCTTLTITIKIIIVITHFQSGDQVCISTTII
jgi:hypothetical protein